MADSQEKEFYEISAVSRLTGLSTHVLRVWEKRYGVVEPDRTDTGRRHYSRDDIHRLTLLKSLVDSGHTISSISKLDIESLEERLSQVREQSGDRREAGDGFPQCRVGFVGIQARAAVRDAADVADGFSIAAEFGELSELVNNLKPGAIDILIVETGTLFPDDVKKIQQAVEELSARRAIVIYQFANAEVFKSGNIEKVTALRSPVNSSEILLACDADIKLAISSTKRVKTDLKVDESPIPPKIFTPEQLRSICKEASAVKCECPQHLTNLLTGLAAFEEYSGRCENLNEEDAKLHIYLHQETANCRLRMELALQQVLESEGILI